MADDPIQLDQRRDEDTIIKVLGVGGGGSNAVNHMFNQGITGVEFVVCNTDNQALENSPVATRIQLGSKLTEGRGAGNKPEKGRDAAMESIEKVREVLETGTKMVFITAGMGGGTGTGAAPVIAKVAQELNLLTVGIVTVPFKFEGKQRIHQALEGIRQIRPHVDSLLIIHNERLREIYGDLKLSEAFAQADNVLAIAAKGIAEIITVHGHVNVDFEDVNTVMRGSGVAIMGTGMAEGENRALEAIKRALISPLLNNNNLKGARNILLNITSGSEEVRMDEIGEITDFIKRGTGVQSNIIWGNGVDKSLENSLNVTIVATGFNTENSLEGFGEPRQKESVTLNDSDSESNPDEFVISGKVENENQNESAQNPDDIPFEKSYGEEQDSSGLKPEKEVEEEDEKKEKPAKIRIPKKSKAKKKPKSKPKEDSGNLNEWFKKRFSGIFDDKDEQLE